MRQGWLLDLDGITPYAEAWALQRTLVAARQRGAIDDGLILLEHDPVFTVGRSAKPDHLLFPRELLTARGFGVFDIERGGSVTYHGPGQLVGYPILDLRSYDEDIGKFMRTLEQVLITVLDDFGVPAARLPGYPGVWVEDTKIAAVGVAVKRKVTMHGFALNVDPDLSHFGLINPCGLGRDVTSMATVAGHAVPMGDVRSRAAARFGQAYGLALRPVTLAALLAAVQSTETVTV
ncbi:MAG TPA: lipoyl(octanoyl) transferase LipB [bacterium]|jgi:lipoate-protein ligase B|nr:lipoyl(octanoyl) transferase LipB [bacterium]